MIKVKQLHPEAQLPTKSHSDDAGYDVYAIDDGVYSPEYGYIEYKLGMAVQIPKGYYLELVPRSSISKYDLLLCNPPGIIDCSFRGEICVRFKVVAASPRYRELYSDQESYEIPKFYKKGDRIAQLIMREQLSANFQWSNSLSETSRGSGGFGSTGS